jgi:LysM repeat protein
MDFCNEVQVLGYDYYGYYTDDAGYQLSLVDTDYVVQEGDTWYSISRRHGIPLNDLLALNRAIETERVFAGQVVRIA